METPTETSDRDHLPPLDRRFVFSILILAFLIRISAAWVWQSQLERDHQFFRFGDSHSYWTMAGRIAAGEPFQYGSSESKVFRAPLYPLVLAPFTLLSDGRLSWSSVMAARFLGCLLGTWTVWLIIRWTQTLAGNQSALMERGFGAGDMPVCASGAAQTDTLDTEMLLAANRFMMGIVTSTDVPLMVSSDEPSRPVATAFGKN